MRPSSSRERKCGLDLFGIEAEAGGNLLQRERAVGARIASREFQHRSCYRCEKRCWNAGWKRNSEGVAIAGCVFDGDEALLVRDFDLQQPPRSEQAREMVEQIGRCDASGEFFAREIAEAQEQIVDSVGGAGASGLGERLQLLLDLGDGVGVEQFAQVGVAEQIAELLLIDGERLGAAFGERGIAVVDVIGNVAEEQRRGEGRGRLRVDDVDAHLAIAR